MELVEQREQGLYLVRAVEDHGIQVGDRHVRSSFLLTPNRVEENFSARGLDDFTPEIIATILALEPAVVLVGTGPRQHLPAPALMAEFMRRGIGLETMDSRAAARTYNLLASEGREVVVAFLLQSPTD